jgi:hypothetical protein
MSRQTGTAAPVPAPRVPLRDEQTGPVGVEGLGGAVLYIVIAHFRRGFEDRGCRSAVLRVEPEPAEHTAGLRFLGSWVEASLRRCFQVVDCNEAAALHRWTAQWRHCVDFDVIPVLPSDEAVAALQPLLD